MFRLKTGNYTNEKIIEKVKGREEEILKLFNGKDFDTLRVLILKGSLSTEALKTIILMLTFGKELFGIDKKVADLLFFTCYVNYKNTNGEFPNKLSTMEQARLFYRLTEGNVESFESQCKLTNKEERYSKIYAKHKGLVDGTEITWEIPVFFYKDLETKQNRVTVFHPTLMFGFVSSPQIKRTAIPRVVYLRFLKHLPNIIRNTDEIRNAFDETATRELVDLFTYLGLEEITRVSNKDIDVYMKDNEVYIRALTNQVKIENAFFTQMDYRTYYGKETNVIPLMRSKDIILYRGDSQ